MAGDTRAMSQPTLLSLHNAFLLEHNFLAEGIEKAGREAFEHLGAKDKDEMIFQVWTSLSFISVYYIPSK